MQWHGILGICCNGTMSSFILIFSELSCGVSLFGDFWLFLQFNPTYLRQFLAHIERAELKGAYWINLCHLFKKPKDDMYARESMDFE